MAPNCILALGGTGLYSGKTLAERALGRFYTPDVLGASLARRIVRALSEQAASGDLGSVVRLSDPFAGDGRLIASLLAEASLFPSLSSRSFVVTLRDMDEGALKMAASGIRSLARHLGLRAIVDAKAGDSLAQLPEPTQDAVVTNPPWELLKPDGRETAGLAAGEEAEYVTYLRRRSAELDARFPDARADVSWAGWGTNLARCGLDVAVRSCRPDGLVGIVLPATLLSDQASESMRRSLVDRTALLEMSVFPSEARLFARVDQPVVTAVLRVGVSGGVASVVRFDRCLEPLSTTGLEWSHAALGPRRYALASMFGGSFAETLGESLRGLPSFGDLEGPGASDLWAGRELDETRLAEKLVAVGEHLFVKGRMVRRHGMAEQPSLFVRRELAVPLHSCRHERLVWRDVARASQRRRMIGTLIPPFWVAGNSLHVAYFRDGNGDRLRALYAVVSSLVFELQVRARLGTGHMSLGAVRQARVPRLVTSLVRRLSALVRSGADEARLEVAVARAYGLDREDMRALAAEFPKLTEEDRSALLSSSLWRGAQE